MPHAAAVCFSMSLCFVPQVQSHGSQPPRPYNNISLYLPSRLPPPPILIMQLFSFLPGGGLPWTNIVPYTGSCGGPYCVWRNGELTPMSEPSQWGHCVWIFLRLNQSHLTFSPCTDQVRGCAGCSPVVRCKNVHITANWNSPIKHPIIDLGYFNFRSVSYSFISTAHCAEYVFAAGFGQERGSVGVWLLQEAPAIPFSSRKEQSNT